jgi:hypothetical protein
MIRLAGFSSFIENYWKMGKNFLEVENNSVILRQETGPDFSISFTCTAL